MLAQRIFIVLAQQNTHCIRLCEKVVVKKSNNFFQHKIYQSFGDRTMGIFSRMSDIFKANVNDQLDKAEDPEKMLKQMVIEMEESVNKATLAVGNAIANEKTLERKLLKAREESNNWHQKAMQAVNAGRDDLAKAALEKKALYERNTKDLEPTYQQAKDTSVKMRAQLDTLKSKLDEARTRQNTLIARSQAAKAQKQIAQAFSGVGSDAFSKFDKFESKVEQLESQADAFGQLAGDNTALEDQFKQLDRASTDSELLALKASMGKLPAASPSASSPSEDPSVQELKRQMGQLPPASGQ
jgi:phage shock protein A